MKTIDNINVSSRSYYFLLDFNEKDDWLTIAQMFNVTKLSELTIKQYAELFKIASEKEYINLIKKN